MHIKLYLYTASSPLILAHCAAAEILEWEKVCVCPNCKSLSPVWIGKFIILSGWWFMLSSLHICDEGQILLLLYYHYMWLILYHWTCETRHKESYTLILWELLYFKKKLMYLHIWYIYCCLYVLLIKMVHQLTQLVRSMENESATVLTVTALPVLWQQSNHHLRQFLSKNAQKFWFQLLKCKYLLLSPQE